MSYQQGFITSPTPAQALMAVLDGVITAHPAWTFIEQVVSGAKTARVYRNNKTVSGLPNDFFVVIWRDTDAGQVYFDLCEVWDAAGKLLKQYAPAQSAVSGSGSFQVIAADGTVGTTGQAFDSAHVLAATPFDTTIIGNSFPYYLSVTNHRICFAQRNAGWVYAGAYESLPGYYDPFPIVLLTNGHASFGAGGRYQTQADQLWYYFTAYAANSVGLGYSSTTSAALPVWCGSFTRQWRTSVQAATAWSVRPYCLTPMYPARGMSVPYWSYRDPVTQRWWPMRVGLNQGHASLGTNNGDVRGLLRDVMQLDPMNGYPSNGDTISIEGVEHVCMCRSIQAIPGEHLFVSKAA